MSYQVIEGLEHNVNLKSLWLGTYLSHFSVIFSSFCLFSHRYFFFCTGKNKIEVISGLETLVNITQLDIQNNRLTEIGTFLLC